jgi:hypothetical protein
MGLSAIIATSVLAVLIVFVGMVLIATMRQIDGEARRAADQRDGWV